MMLQAAGEVISGGETAAFWILGPIALIAAIALVLSRNAVHSALWLVVVMMCISVFYVIQA